VRGRWRTVLRLGSGGSLRNEVVFDSSLEIQDILTHTCPQHHVVVCHVALIQPRSREMQPKE
jgi:hypothetical protein